MKRLFLSIAVLLCISLTMSVNAQEKKKDGERRFPMEKELNLSADQKQKMESVHSDFSTKMKELKDNSNLTKEDKQAKMKDLRDQHMAEVGKILTPEQQTKMKEMREKRGNMDMKRGGVRGKGDMRGDRGGMRGDMMAKRGDRMKDLNLTDDQKEKIKSVNEDFRTKSKDLTEQHREALGKIYTPEQQEKLKEMRKDRPRDGQFGFQGKKRGNLNLDQASKDKLKTLKESFEKEKKAVELSRIAPDAQKKKITDLRDNYRKERRQIISDARKTKENKPS